MPLSVSVCTVLVCVQGSDDACLRVSLRACVVWLTMASANDWGSSPQHVSVFAFTFGLNAEAPLPLILMCLEETVILQELMDFFEGSQTEA